METIRTKLMTKIAVKFEAAQKYVGPLCPKIQKKVDKVIDQSNKCVAKHAVGLRYQVLAEASNQFVVDLQARSCSCRRWDLTCIPCIHVVAAMFITKERPESYVDDCYNKETQLKIYSHFISPINGASQWKHVENQELILPPVIRRPLGRPRKNRKKEADEPSVLKSRISKKRRHI
ncbi:hypothetical protein PTKIN_Ptkin13bG0039100 [Pterospermum kingtungense]